MEISTTELRRESHPRVCKNLKHTRFIIFNFFINRNLIYTEWEKYCKKIYVFIKFSFDLWTTPRDAQGLVLVLSSAIVPADM